MNQKNLTADPECHQRSLLLCFCVVQVWSGCVHTACFQRVSIRLGFFSAKMNYVRGSFSPLPIGPNFLPLLVSRMGSHTHRKNGAICSFGYNKNRV